MLARLLAPLLLLSLAACPNDKGGDTDSDGTSTGTNDTSTGGTDATSTAGTDATSTDGTGADDPTDGAEVPPAGEVCPASCDKFQSCASDPGMFDHADCVVQCEGTISFLDMNNPGAGCGDSYLGLHQCFSTLTCDQIDAYFMDAPMRPCGEWGDKLGECAIE